MSEGETKKDEGQEVVLDAAALKVELDKMKATNERLLAESKENKNKYTTLKTTVENETKTKLEQEQNWKELLETEKKTTAAMSEEFTKLKKQTLRKSLDFEVAKYAKDAYEIEDIINSLDKSSLKIDEETLSISGVEEAINALRSKKSYLFNTTKKSTMVDERPGITEPKKTVKEKLTINESLVELKGLMAQGF